VPVSAMFCVLLATPPESSVTTTLPVAAPVCVGWNVMLMEQEFPAASEAGQLFICVKAPFVAIDEMLSGAVPLFESVTGCAAAVVPARCRAKVREVGESEATAAFPVPESGTV